MNRNRSTIQLKPPGNWINDPNGFIYYKGQYHLFYQHNPKAPVWDTMHWGHAVSDDLITWEHKGIALYPSCASDRDGCYSGSAVEKDGILHLFYTGVQFGKRLGDVIEAAQLHIESEDGFTFDNDHGKTVAVPPLTDVQQGDYRDTRDPKVWKEGDGYTMVIGSTEKLQRGMLAFFRSPDLYSWEWKYSVKGDPSRGFMWECPDLFRVNGRDVLLVSMMGLLKDGLENENQTVCMLPEYSPEDCSIRLPDEYTFFDSGMDLYAPQSTLDAEGRRIVTAWARMPEPVNGEWCGILCAPRVVEVSGNHVYFRMHPDIREAFAQNRIPEEEKKYLRLRLKNGESAEIDGFRLTRKDDILYADRSQVYVNNPDARTQTHTGTIREGDLVEVLADPNLIEVYVNDGEYVLTNVVYH